jgi:2-succinyl-5-enolpyruvyl-6-hydroxy-3-cyclohexene-1-carboxylate synthase
MTRDDDSADGDRAHGDDSADGDRADAYPNRNVLWAETLVDELARSGLDAVVVSPGSRSTPLTVAFASHDDVSVYSVLDERSAAFFALGRARRTGEPTALVCTSGTAAANYHPAIVEASQARVPLLALTADRPPELRDSGANQTVDQEKLYGSAVRWYRDLPEPEATPRKLRRLRTDAARAIAETQGTPAGPVHVNCPFRKPLEPLPVEGDVPADWDEGDDRAARGSGGGDGRAYVETDLGRPTLPAERLDALADRVAAADSGLVVAGPADPVDVARDEYTSAIADLGSTAGFPVFADALSTVRFGSHVANAPVVGGYDGAVGAYVDAVDPDIVIRFGASPTSKPLRKALAERGVAQVMIDRAGEWRDAEFATDALVAADPTHVATELVARLDGPVSAAATEATARAVALDEAFREGVVAARADADVGAFEGEVLADAIAHAPDPSTVVVGNSMPVRDADRFAAVREDDVTVLANRGASGIDGVTSTALGAGSATDDDLVYVTGDLAYYHDLTGLLSLARCDVDATIVVVNNDGGGIFQELPIADFDPPFSEHFQTPHGMDFEPTGDLFDVAFDRVPLDEFAGAYREALAGEGSSVIEVAFDAAASHDARDDATAVARANVRERLDQD